MTCFKNVPKTPELLLALKQQRRQKFRAVGLPLKRWIPKIVVPLDVLYTMFGVLISSFVLAAYIYPGTFLTIRAIGYIVKIHVVLGSMIVFGLAAAAIGILGIIGVYKRNDFFSGIQIVLILVFVLVQTSVFFSFFTEWEKNMHIGISMAVHTYSLKDVSSTYMNDIQNLFACCGAKGPSDYNVANVYFSENHVPMSCCASQNCTASHGHSDHIHTDFSYQNGCRESLHSIVYVLIITISTMYLSLEFLTVAMTILMCALNNTFTDEEETAVAPKARRFENENVPMLEIRG